MLSSEMIQLIENHSAGMVATRRADGNAAVSPKATFVVLDSATIAFGNIRSPGTVANLRRHPELEVCFLDVLERKAVRIAGSARIVRKREATPSLAKAFNNVWPDYVDLMSAYVVISISAAELILSPAYDIGMTESELRELYRAKLGIDAR
ncbi:MAG: pyridoxamine 5'-phosphate oxidase family protein [Rhodobacteraceae bacterium]|nr:pyridoxamine 5'-phosphate oxidase family protein [Paracoccaceae bacterium]